MSFDGWLLALHLLSAAALVGACTILWILVLRCAASTDQGRYSR